MRRDLSAVTVRTAGHHVDVTVPNTVPLLELTPAIAELCGVEGEDARPPAWTLARPGRPPFPLTTTLADAQVLDGEVLHLVDTAAWDSPRVVTFDDPIASSAVTERERPAAALREPVLAVAAGMLLLTGAGVAAAVPAVRATAGPALLAAAAALLTVAYLLPQVPGARAARPALACGTWATAFVAGWGLTSGVPHAGPTGGAVALLAAAPAARPLAGPRVPGGTVFATGLTAACAAVAAGARPVQAAAALAVAATVTLRVGPRLLSARLGRRAARAPGRVEALTRGSRTTLVSGTYGCVAVAVGAAAVLAASGGGFALGLAAVTACSLALRAATFRYARESLPAAIGAVLAGTAAVAGLAGALVAVGWAGVGVAVAGAAGAGLAVFGGMRRETSGGPGRVTTLWAFVDGATAPLVLTAAGVLTALADLVGGLFR